VSCGLEMMTGWRIVACLAVLAALLLAGCNGTLLQHQEGDGQQAQVKIDGGESWDSYDNRPRYPFDKRKSNDEMSIMLKSEATF
jgi:hypothetical protein